MLCSCVCSVIPMETRNTTVHRERAWTMWTRWSCLLCSLLEILGGWLEDGAWSWRLTKPLSPFGWSLRETAHANKETGGPDPYLRPVLDRVYYPVGACGAALEALPLARRAWREARARSHSHSLSRISRATSGPRKADLSAAPHTLWWSWSAAGGAQASPPLADQARGKVEGRGLCGGSCSFWREEERPTEP